MNETETKTEAAQAPVQETLSPRRRTALVTYLAILFAVAFLFVALMMVAETKRLKTMNEELQDNSQKTSASLTNNINALQEENRRLSDRNEELNGENELLRQQILQAEEEKTALQEQLEALNGEKLRLEGEKTALEEETEALRKQAQNAVEVSELLHRAMAADEEGNYDGLRELLDQIEEMKEFLSPTEQEIYEELKIA